VNRLRLSLKQISIISILAGIIYNSWPLGLFVNPVVTKYGQASQLAASHQPYQWVFRYGDVCASLLMALVCYLIWQAYKAEMIKRRYVYSLFLILGFGVFASIAALVPVQCVSALHVCPNFVHNPLTFTHAISSVIGPLCLFLALCFLRTKKTGKFLDVQIGVCFITGLITFILQFIPGSDVFIQDVFIAVCSFCLVVYPYDIVRLSLKSQTN
jgi:hypothetical protein